MTIEEVIVELESFVYWLAERRQSDTILMEFDELVGELFLELVKGFQYYQDKDLTLPQMKAVLRRMMDNRIGELVHRYYTTHRKLGNDALDLYSFDEHEDTNSEISLPRSIRTSVVLSASLYVDPENIISSQERVQLTLERISNPAKQVLYAILEGDDLLIMNLELAGDRMTALGKNGDVKLQPWHVADALGMDEVEVRRCFAEIKRVYKEVTNGN